MDWPDLNDTNRLKAKEQRNTKFKDEKGAGATGHVDPQTITREHNNMWDWHRTLTKLFSISP